MESHVLIYAKVIHSFPQTENLGIVSYFISTFEFMIIQSIINFGYRLILLS